MTQTAGRVFLLVVNVCAKTIWAVGLSLGQVASLQISFSSGSGSIVGLGRLRNSGLLLRILSRSSATRRLSLYRCSKGSNARRTSAIDWGRSLGDFARQLMTRFSSAFGSLRLGSTASNERGGCE